MSIPDSDRFFTLDELREMKFKHLGRSVRICRTVRLLGAEYMSIGDFSAIDEYCVLSGNLEIGRNVHIAHGCRVIAGREGISMDDFSGLAFAVTIFAQSDDYGGDALTNPTVPMKFRNIKRAHVSIGRHVIIGASTVVFPGVVLAEGSSVGACSMVTRSTEPWAVYFGAPARRLKARSRRLLALEQQYLSEGTNDSDR